MKLIVKYRLYYLILFLFTILLGLGSRRYGSYLPAFVADVLFPKKEFFRKGFIALSFSYCIEISQLYQADWINAIRGTTLGALVLGHGFLWSDILCYTVGVGLAILIDFTLFINKEYI